MFLLWRSPHTLDARSAYRQPRPIHGAVATTEPTSATPRHANPASPGHSRLPCPAAPPWPNRHPPPPPPVPGSDPTISPLCPVPASYAWPAYLPKSLSSSVGVSKPDQRERHLKPISISDTCSMYSICANKNTDIIATNSTNRNLYPKKAFTREQSIQ